MTNQIILSDHYDRCELPGASLAPCGTAVATALSPRCLFGVNDKEPAILRMFALSETTGLPFYCVEAHSGAVIAKSDDSVVALLPWMVQSQLAGTQSLRIVELSSGLIFYVVPLPAIDDVPTVGLGYVLTTGGECPEEVRQLADELQWDDDELERWCSRQHHCRPEMLERLLVTVLESQNRERELGRQLDEVISQIQHTYEEIGALHTLTANLQISRSPLDLAELCLDRIYELIEARGNLVLIDENEQRQHLLVKGDVPLDENDVQRLVERFESHDWGYPVIKNNLDGTLLGSELPGIRNLIMARISDGTHHSGWLILCNLPDGRDFGTVESSLLKSMSTIMATHHHNQALYREHEDLLMQFVSSLVSTLDARDPYTRGHSERVATIARRIGKELRLPDEELEDIYQAGLLHDIGKIGINDSVLQKQADLTDEEFEQIKEHPVIGYRILKGLRNLQKLLPGVRNHHEEFLGGGYPDGLVGEEIPLLARILAVADAYDAMRSDRPYRKGLPHEKVENIFRCGAGQQWDPAIIDAYFRARDEVRQIGDAGVCATTGQCK